jgi:hypothetical protein
MSYDHLSKHRRKEISLALSKKAAEKGKDSNFKQWWYFDTNCISELVKLSSADHKDKVQEFLTGKEVLFTSTSIQELSKAPDILQNTPSAFETAQLYLAPDITKFWYSDFINFFNDDQNRIPINSLDVYPLQSDLIEMVLNSRKSEFEEACGIFNEEVSRKFFNSVLPDIGANFDERDLCVHIWKVINEYSQMWFELDIPIANSCSNNFPSFYAFFYSYYFRYVKNRDVKPELNDFIDLENCLAAPYCKRYYCESTFANVLNTVKGRKPPTAFHIVKKLYKTGYIKPEVYEAQRREKDKLSRSRKLLLNTDIFSFAEMRSHVL